MTPEQIKEAARESVEWSVDRLFDLLAREVIQPLADAVLALEHGIYDPVKHTRGLTLAREWTKPKCETCGGIGHIPVKALPNYDEPCPDCKEDK